MSAGHPRRRIRRLAGDAEVKLANAFQRSGWLVRDLQANRDIGDWLEEARKVHADATASMRDLIEANFAWGITWRLPWKRRRKEVTAPDTGKAIEESP